MQRIAVVSDIHGNIAALEKVAADIEDRGISRVFNLGDHISGPLFPKDTLEFLKKQDWLHLSGNHDRQLVQQKPEDHGLSDQYAFRQLSEVDLAWLRGLPASLAVESQILLFHGTPKSDLTYLLETVEHGRVRLATQDEIAQRLGGEKAAVMLCGHTHQPRVVQTPGGSLIVNPGSVGLPAYDDGKPEYHVSETGSPHARYAILEHVNGAWQVELVFVSYDFEQAARQADKNDRPEWAYALRTGFMPRSEVGR